MQAQANIEKAIEEINIALVALEEFKKKNNIEQLRKSYDAISNSRKLLGDCIKEVKSI